MTERNKMTTAHELDCIALDEPEEIDHLSDVDRGDRVLIDERQRPLTVVQIGVRSMGDERINKEIETPMVKLEGHWPGAKTIVLAHKIQRLGEWGEEYEPELEETDTIVEMEIGREVDVRRTHVVGASGRAEAEAENRVSA